jgi:hypothetical protein
MRTIRITGIFRLATNAAASYARMRAEDLPSGGINSAWRSDTSQRRLFLSRYVRSKNRFTDKGPFGDVRKYEGVWYKRMHGFPVSVPGTSKHNQGLAIDTSVGKPVHTWLLSNGKHHGWSRPLIGADPVHWEYSLRKDKARRRKPGPHVVTAGPLRGRAGPSTASRVVTKKRKGAVVVIDRWVRSEGRVWGQATDRLYYAKEFLKREV